MGRNLIAFVSTTCGHRQAEGPIRVARPMPWRAAATPWPDWSTGRIPGHSRFNAPVRIVHLPMRIIPRVSLRSVLRAAPACSAGAVFSEQERMEQWNSREGVGNRDAMILLGVLSSGLLSIRIASLFPSPSEVGDYHPCLFERRHVIRA